MQKHSIWKKWELKYSVKEKNKYILHFGKKLRFLVKKTAKICDDFAKRKRSYLNDISVLCYF